MHAGDTNRHRWRHCWARPAATACAAPLMAPAAANCQGRRWREASGGDSSAAAVPLGIPSVFYVSAVTDASIYRNERERVLHLDQSPGTGLDLSGCVWYESAVCGPAVPGGLQNSCRVHQQ